MGDFNAKYCCQLILLWTIYMQFTLTAAAPACRMDSGAQKCRVSSNADIFRLPEATEIHIELSENHTVQLKNGVFPALTTLRKLSIDLRYISDVGDNAFISLTELMTLVFHNSDIYRPHNPKSISTNAFRGLGKLKELRAPNSGMKTIDANALEPLVALTSVDLSDNLLESIPSKLFARTTGLTSINLKTNQIASIPRDAFSTTKQLVSLDLSQNVITNITDGTFSNNSALLQLSLDNNLLTSLSSSVLSGLTHIESLKLNNNRITSVNVNTFSSANKLNSLDLSSNMIEYLTDNTFSALPQVEFLELFNNKLKILSSNTLSGLSNLKYFDAYNNQIEIIEDAAFRHSPQLVSLHLHYNDIRNISVSAFTGLNSLSVLTLYNNSLSGLPKGVFSNLGTMNLLDISANPWTCDCSLFWLKAWFSSAGTSMKLENPGTTSCAGTGQLVTVYLNNAANQCAPTTSVPLATTSVPPATTSVPPASTTSESTTAGVPKPTQLPSTAYMPTTMTVVVIDDRTGLHEKVTPVEPEPATLVSAKQELSDAEKGGIIAACLFAALLIIILIVLFLYCRHKRYFFWKPQKVPKTASLHLKERQETERIVREQLRLAAQQNSHRYYDPEIGNFAWNDPRGMVQVVDNGVIVNGNYTITNDRPLPHPQSVYTLPNSTPNLKISAPSVASNASRTTDDSGFMISPPLPPPSQRSGFSNMAFEDSGSEMSPVSPTRHFHPPSHSSLPGIHHTTPLTESVVLGMLSPSTPTGPSGYLYPINSKAKEHQYATIDGAGQLYNEHPYDTINDNELDTLPIRPDLPGAHDHTYQELQSSFDPRNYMIKPVDESTPVSDSTKTDFEQDTIAKPPLDLDTEDDSTLGHKDAFSDSINSQCASISSASTLDDSVASAEATSPQSNGYKKRKPVPKPRKLHKSTAKNAEEDFPPVFDEI